MTPCTAWRVTCPSCHADTGQPCTTRAGRALAAGHTHRARWSQLRQTRIQAHGITVTTTTTSDDPTTRRSR